jgi:hypothetical protein
VVNDVFRLRWRHSMVGNVLDIPCVPAESHLY